MSDKLTIVFADERRERAYLLRNRLAEEGIEAFIVNDALQGALGGVPLGWTSAARVAVAEQDAEPAVTIVRQFEAEQQESTLQTDVQEYEHEPTAGAPDGEPLEPTQCPDCGRSRMAVCPVCQTARSDFPPVDPVPANAVPGNAAPGDDRGGLVADPRLLICTTCDEPFAPGYLARCEWCGHDFGTGIRPAEPVTREPMDSRVVAAVLGLSLAGLAILAYFALLLSQ